MICQEIKCPDYLIKDGPPAWCYRAGQPAQVAVQKCPKINTPDKREDEGERNESKQKSEMAHPSF
jgi:hypothetical protein